MKMRLALICGVAVAMFGLGGCASALSAGRSPEQVKVAYATPGYVERDFADMHPDLP